MIGSMVIGPESVDAVLRRRGFTIEAKGSTSDVLIPLERQPALSGQTVNEFRRLFGKASFRKICRLLTARKQAAIRQLEEIAPQRSTEYVRFLVDLGVARHSNNDEVALTRQVDNIGPTLEWYVADVCKRDFDGSAAWSVKLSGLRYGDFDVAAWLPPTLVSIETKSSKPSEVTDDHLRHFLQRSVELSPDLAILLIDTDDDLDRSELLVRLFDVMLPAVRRASGIDDVQWRPEKPFIAPQPRYPGVSFGYFRFYVTNSQPSIIEQLRRCLRHYNSEVKGKAYVGGERVNFITGELE